MSTTYNARGKRADFHSLRYTLATNLALAGTPPRVAMEIMRHSDMRLTARTYTDAGLLPVWDKVANLPSFTTGHPVKDSQIDYKIWSGRVLPCPSPAKRSCSRATCNLLIHSDIRMTCPRLSRPVKKTSTGRGDRIRTCRSPSKNQELTEDDTLIDTLGLRAEVCEVVSVWPELPHALREGILAIVRSSRKVPTAIGCSENAISADASPPSKSRNPRQTRSHLPGPAKRGR